MNKKKSQKVAFMLGLVGLVALLSVIFGSYILNTNVDNRADAATVRRTTSTKSTSSTTSSPSDYSQPIAASITLYENNKALAKTDNVVANKTYKIQLTMAPVGDWGRNNVIIGTMMTYDTLAEISMGDTVAGSLVLHHVDTDKFEGTFKFGTADVGKYILVRPDFLRFSNGQLGLALTQRTGSYLEGGKVVAK